MNFLSAIGFLTTLPKASRAFREDGRQILYFPLVGLVIGGMLYGLDLLLSHYVYTEIRVIADVLFLAGITGALHLDGLADTADGFFSHRSRKRILEIMKDSQIGVMGALAVMFCLLLKIAGLFGIKGEQNFVWLLTAPALARSSQVIGLTFMDYPRDEGGIAKIFFQKGNYSLLAFIAIPLALPFLISVKIGIISILLFAGIVSGLLWYCKYMIGGVTGDTLGAMTELVEMSFFVLGGIICMNQSFFGLRL